MLYCAKLLEKRYAIHQYSVFFVFDGGGGCVCAVCMCVCVHAYVYSVCMHVCVCVQIKIVMPTGKYHRHGGLVAKASAS